jgi:hemoglobin/transferrin/lactoferrin receptor protein
MKLTKNYSTVLLLLLFAWQINAQNIKVIDKSTNLPIADYSINIQKDVTSNITIIQVNHPDYKPYTKQFVGEVKDDSLVFLLTPSVLKMDEVVISANRFQEKHKDVPRQIQTISANTIRFQNRQNTADLLEQNGNVFVQRSQQGGGSPVLRGFESNRVLLVVDGVRMNNAIYRGGHLQNVIRINQNMLARTEILFGGGSVLYGSDALGGVMYFETLKPQLNKMGGNAYYRFGSVNEEATFHADVNIGLKKWAHIFSVTHSNFGDLKQGSNKDNVDGDTIYQRNYYATRINGRDTMTKNSDPYLQLGTAYAQYDVMYKALYQANMATQHILNVQFSNTNNVPRYDRLNEWKGNTYRSAEWFYGPELRSLVSYQYNQNLNRSYADKLRVTVAYQYIEESRNDRNWQSTTLNRRNEYVHVGTLNVDASKTIRQDANNVHEIRYGLDGQYNLVNSNANGKNINTGAVTGISTRYPDGGSSMNYLAAFVSHAWEIGKKWVISDGLRFNYVQLNSTFNNKAFFPFLENSLTQQNSAINGNIGVVYNPIKPVKLYSNASTAFRAPNLDDVNKVFDSKSGEALITPNPNLKPEYTYNIELGISALVHKKVKIDAVGYYTLIQNAIVVNASKLNGLDSAVYSGKNTKVFSNQNAQQAYIFGYSVQLAADITQNLLFSTSLNYTYGRIQTDSTDIPLDHIPPVFGRTAIAYTYKKLNIEASSLYNGWKRIADYNLAGEDNPMYATPQGSPAWYVLNIRAQYSFGKKGKLQAQLGVDNITDNQYRVFASGMSAAGRNIWACVRIRI